MLFRSRSTDEYETKLWNLNNLVSGDENLDIKDKFSFYEHYYNVSLHQRNHVDNMCHELLKGITWMTKYYFDECPSWTWYYPYDHSPYISDIYNYIKNKRIDINKLVFKKTSPIKPLMQLLLVVPPSCKYLLPKSYQDLLTDFESPIIDLYPIDFKQDTTLVIYKIYFSQLVGTNNITFYGLLVTIIVT